MSPGNRLPPPTTPPASLAVGLIRRAARHAPQTLAERLEEEWLAHLEAHPSPLGRLRFALGCCWATCVIAHEHGAAPAGAVLASGRAALHDMQALLPRRASAFLLVLCAHLGALYLLSTWLTFHKQPPEMPVVVTLQVDTSPVP